jgi:hypothetical protein
MTFNTKITSRILDTASATTEALLILGQSTGQVTSLVVGQNVFYGKLCGANSMCWYDVPVPQDSVLRLTNLRVDASAIGPSGTLTPSQVFSFLTFTGPNIFVTNPQTSVGFVLKGFTFTSLPSTPGPTAGQTIVPIRFGEGFPIAFKNRIDALQDPSTPGVVYNTESGFVASQILGSAGVADTPTRLHVQFRNVPAGTTIYAPVTSNENKAQLVSANSSGAGGSAITGAPRAGGMYQAIGSGPTAFATWEVTAANPFTIETVTFNVLFEAPAGTDLSQIQMEGMLAPLSNVVEASATAPVPRFLRTTPTPVAGKIDFNLDGHTDIVWQDPVSGLAQVWFLNGATTLTTLGAANLTSSNTWRVVGTGDFNADGRTDVVWQDPATGASQVWFLGGAQGNVVTGSAVIGGANAWRIRSVADFNADGKPDLLWQDEASGFAQVWFLGGANGTSVTGSANLTASNSWRIAGAADLNKDGVTDVLWQDLGTGATQVWFMGGANGTSIASATSLTGATTWRINSVGDVNGDASPDVVWQDPATGTSQVWFLGGSQGVSVTSSAALSTANSWRIVGPR